MAAPVSKGSSVLVAATPTFADYIVIEGTWEESDPLDIEKEKDGNGETIIYTGADPGVDVQCEVVIKATKTPLAKLDQITATYPDASTKKFLVVEATLTKKGGKPWKQKIKLEHRSSMTYA